jgi:16S rRNA (cytosine1402-N4)-methyltransferase
MNEINRVEHKPVLENEVLEAFKNQLLPLFLDGTFGRGGHARKILEAHIDSNIIAFDRDLAAIAFAGKEFGSYLKCGRLKIINDDFKNLKNHSVGPFDGALLDLGVSSPQLDVAERGFSFMNDGPLDMRMNQDQELLASEIINTYSEKELSDIFYHWGEVRHPNRVVRAIVNDRVERPFTTTRQLASLIERVEGWKKKGSHPATNFFMALRIAVNGELEGLSEFLEAMPLFMNDGARLCVISFHSLEDRIVKNAFRKMHLKQGVMINKKVIIAGEVELSENPRSRSAKLRVFEVQKPSGEAR